MTRNNNTCGNPMTRNNNTCGNPITKFFGKYRGKVENNADTLQMGRLEVSAPAVLDNKRVWAMPSVPYAGPNVGFFAMPPVGANIWVEFEGGDLNYPIWSGCFWGEMEVPIKPASANKKVFKTASITLTFNDTHNEGGFTVEVDPPTVPTPLKLAFNKQGIEINGKPAIIKLTNSGIEITHNPGTNPASVKISSINIEMNSGKANVKLDSNTDTVSINNEGLQVT